MLIPLSVKNKIELTDGTLPKQCPDVATAYHVRDHSTLSTGITKVFVSKRWLFYVSCMRLKERQFFHEVPLQGDCYKVSIDEMVPNMKSPQDNEL
ncbi:unnamed protein product [Lactuca virosa]|uniref:Uncharacterized protein n=1 Tax=Lactuca virosa TaxID=75947 RepID=A0AAU9NNR5_9ASTR|nr:unnamed protein product [Lactuca virosa]